MLLIAATASLCQREIEGTLPEALGVNISSAWPPEHTRGLAEVFAQVLVKCPEDVGFLGWYWCMWCPDEHLHLVGFGGFKGKPDELGWLEIGYAVVDGYHSQGIATEAVGMLVRWCMQFDDVMGVQAHVEPGNWASRKVLERNQFVAVESQFNEEAQRQEVLYIRSFLS